MILNYTTSIKADTSVGQIQSLLAKQGARKIMIEYGPQSEVLAISFEVILNKQNLQFRLPANWRGVQKAISKKKGGVAAKYRTEAHSINVCWRIIKDWIEAQMAIIEAEQADIATVFLPYAVMGNGNTVRENLLSDKGGSLMLNKG